MNHQDLPTPEGIPEMPAEKALDKNKTTETSITYTPRGPSRLSRTWRIVAGSVLLVLLCFLGGFGGARLAGGGLSTASIMSPNSNDGNQIVTKEEKNITSVVGKVSPSVVSVVTSDNIQSAYGTTSQQSSAGTGIIISNDGYIITNHHVVGNAKTATVVSADGTSYKNVSVVGSDPLNDVAFLKIDGVSDLKPATIGDSSTVRVGQQVVAIGNSLGQYHGTVTSGIISATGRPVSAQDGATVENLSDLLQTDAAINPGNSGGPLLNIAGQVIGINTAVAQNAEGIGFAIPINSAKGEIAGVLAGKGVSRSYLGVLYLSVTPEVAQQYKLSVKQGAYVHSTDSHSPIVSGSPADKAGLKPDDIILKVGDTTIGTAGSLSSLIGEYQPGDSVELTVLRGNSNKTIKVKLGIYSSNSGQPN